MMRVRRFSIACAQVIVFLTVVLPGVGILQAQDEREKSLMDLTNQAREEAGLKPLAWDVGLAAAAKAHAERMASEGPISHHYGGEPDLPERAAEIGRAHV